METLVKNMHAECDARIGKLTTEYKSQIEILQVQLGSERIEFKSQIESLQGQVHWLVQQLRGGGVAVPVSIPAQPFHESKEPLVLGVWPNSDLSIRAEMDAIFRSGLRYVTLQNGAGVLVTHASLRDEILRVYPEILHIGAHSTATGVELDDGTADIGWWRLLAKKAPFLRLVVLNSCQSLAIAESMHRAGVLAVVGMRDDISDTMAVAFAQKFYDELSIGASVVDAVDLAKLGLSYIDAEKILTSGNWAIGG